MLCALGSRLGHAGANRGKNPAGREPKPPHAPPTNLPDDQEEDTATRNSRPERPATSNDPHGDPRCDPQTPLPDGQRQWRPCAHPDTACSLPRRTRPAKTEGASPSPTTDHQDPIWTIFSLTHPALTRLGLVQIVIANYLYPLPIQ